VQKGCGERQALFMGRTATNQEKSFGVPRHNEKGAKSLKRPVRGKRKIHAGRRVEKTFGVFWGGPKRGKMGVLAEVGGEVPLGGILCNNDRLGGGVNSTKKIGRTDGRPGRIQQGETKGGDRYDT